MENSANKVEQNIEPQKWINIIAAYEREFAPWEKRVQSILERYTDKKVLQRKRARFNILWSNVQTLIPAVFSRLPKPDVSRRFRDNDPVGRVAALILERALEYEIEHYGDYAAALKGCVLDRFLGGRGTSWVRYEPHTRGVEPDDGYEITEDIDEPAEVLEYECAPVDYVHWRDFGHQIARTWEEVPAIWRRVYMSRPALVERFGEELGNQIPLDTRPEELKKASLGASNSESAQACIYEIWDKQSGMAIWLSKSMSKVLDSREDPLGLDEFWPCPKPLFATITSDSLIPTPDFALYQDQAEQLDILCDRIDGLVKALKVTGVYDAAEESLRRLFTEADNNDLIPVKNWSGFAEKNGLKGAIDIVDLTPIVNALKVAYESIDVIKNQVFEISGIADILRGATDPNETLGAQRIKGQFGTLRLRDMQKQVAEFATSLLQIKAQIICKLFSPESIMQSGAVDQLSEADKQFIPQAIQLLKSGETSSFRIEVQSDSLVQMDENAEKQDRVEFLGAVSGYMGQLLSNAESIPPEMVPMLAQILKFGVTGFKVGKAIEGDIDQAIDAMKQSAAQPRQPKPDPEMAKVQAQLQGKQQEIQFNLQAKQQELAMQAQFNEQQAQRDMQLEQWKQRMQAEEVAHQNQLEAQRAALQAQHDQQLEQMRAILDERMSQMQQATDVLIARLNNETKVEVAEITAQTTINSAQISAANHASES